MKNFVAYVRSILKGKAFMNVFAEGTDPVDPTNVDPQDPPTPKADPKPSGSVNFEELISKARKEERDKLYGEIEKLKKKSNDLLLVIAERDNTIATITGERDKFQTDYTKVAEELKSGVKTNKTVSELTATISGLERELEKLQVKYEQDIHSLQLDAFKKEQIAGAGGEIIPELVTGTNEDEILASIESAKQRYAQITQQALAGVQMPRVNPTAQIQLKEISVEEIAKMTPQQWAEHRKSLGIK